MTKAEFNNRLKTGHWPALRDLAHVLTEGQKMRLPLAVYIALVEYEAR